MHPERDVAVIVLTTLAAAVLLGLVAGIAIDRTVWRRQR